MNVAAAAAAAAAAVAVAETTASADFFFACLQAATSLSNEPFSQKGKGGKGMKRDSLFRHRHRLMQEFEAKSQAGEEGICGRYFADQKFCNYFSFQAYNFLLLFLLDLLK